MSDPREITVPERLGARAATETPAEKEARERLLRLEHKSHPSRLLESTGLPPDLLAEAVRRLGWLAMVAAIGGTAAIALPIAVPSIRLGPSGLHHLWVQIPVVAISASVAIAAFRGWIPTWRVLDVAQAYQIVLCGVFAAMVNSRSWPDEIMPSWSPVAVIVVVGPLIVPATTLRTLVTSIVCALTDPLALFAAVHLGLADMPSSDLMAIRFYPNVVAIVFAVITSRAVHRLGERIARARDMGSYHLIDRVGAGGMGEVWRASHHRLAREAAVKLIRPDRLAGATGPEAAMAAERFEREARAIAALRSPHTVQLYDSGVAADGTLFYVMELLDGVDLETLVREDGPLPPERVVHVLRQAAHSLSEAHARGLVHRDVKPANMMLCRYGEDVDHLKVLDFGLVREHLRSGALVSAEDAVAGTPAYFAPEVATGSRPVDARTDLYALGCTAYYLLTGTLVFPEASSIQMAVAHATARPERPSVRSGLAIPAELEELVLACLEKSPDRRPESARALMRALEAIPLERPWTDARAAAWWAERARPAKAEAARAEDC